MAEIAQIDFTIDGAPAAKTLGELEMKAEQLSAALKDAKIGSAEYGKLNQQLVQTNKQVKNLELGFEALDNEGVASQVGALAGAIGDVTGAMILLGGENETVVKMAANIQQAMGISMAFKGAIEGASAAMKLFNNVVRANPIFLIGAVIAAVIAGVVLLVKNFDAVKQVFTDIAVGIKNLLDGLGAWKYAILAMLGPIGWLYAAWDHFFGEQAKAMSDAEAARERERKQLMEQRKANADAHRERLKNIEAEKNAVIAAADETIDALKLEKDTLEANGQASDAVTIKILEAEKAKTQAVRDANIQKLQSWIEYYKQEAALAGQSEQEFIDSMAKRGVPLQDFYDKANKLIQKNENDVQYAENRITEFKREQSEKRQEIAEKEFEKAEELRKKQEEADLAYRMFLLDVKTKEIEAEKLFNEQLQAERDRLRQEELEAEMFFQEAVTEQEEAQAAKRAEIAAATREQAQNLFDTAERAASQIHQNELKRANEKIARGEQLTQKEINRLKRQEKIEKAFAIARIAQDTAQAVTGAIKAGSTLPFPGNLFAMAAGVAAVLSGIAQAKAIFAETPEIPGGNINTNANVPGGETQNDNVPVINPVQAGSTFLNPEPIKVYVTEGDISNTQNTIKAIVAEATFGG